MNTEILLFGTHQKLTKIPRDIKIVYDNQTINTTKSYKYLGVEINASLNLNTHIDKNFKKMSSRLKLLRKIRPYLTMKGTKCVLSHMIMPVMTYCSMLKLSYSETQLNRIRSFERRSKLLLSGGLETFDFDILNEGKRKVCGFVHDVLVGNISTPFNKYFMLASNRINTRNNNHILVLPKVKLEYGRLSVKFFGAKIFNELPVSLRRRCTDPEYKKV